MSRTSIALALAGALAFACTGSLARADAGDASVPAPPEEVVDLEVRSASSSGQRLASSSAAVTVVDVEQASVQTADLGAVLARKEGISVLRAGGLGAEARVSLQGLGDDQIRLFVDGVPLAFTGLPETLANVPADLFVRAEAYRGVVPIRFGTDALGGAIQLVTPRPAEGSHGLFALTLGEFGTQRVAARAEHRDLASGLFVRAQGFFDHARNDYPMHGIPLPQRDGSTKPGVVHRLHDAYRGGFGELEVGWMDRPFAKYLAVRAFASGFEKELNHDLLMITPYGEVLSRRRAEGATLAYEYRRGRRFTIDGRAGYAHRTRNLRDLGRCAYDWHRNCLAVLPNGGEIFGVPADRKTGEHDLYLRLLLAYRNGPLAQLRFSLSPTYVHGDSHDAAVRAPAIDGFRQRRDLFALVLGGEHELDAFEGRLENVLFAKSYLQVLRGEATGTAGAAAFDRTSHRFGVGDAVRVRLHEWLMSKVSYELGARMPDARETFGDGVLVDPNLALRPESSHNLNAELRFTREHERIGRVSLGASGFLRYVSDFIFLLPGPGTTQYQNLADATIRGAEGTLSYASAGSYFSADANVTYQDMRNRADRGPFAQYQGARIPNRPFAFANLTLSGRMPALFDARDALTLTLRGQYVGKFYRAFEVASASERDAIPRQLVSSIVLTYELVELPRSASMSLEINNLTDARVYDFFGVQRPGRYALAKWTLRL